ncbi:MAG TPA: hypothetical protein VLK35_04810 [Methylomirabilota bacterium]|nr:hypothetical protein [Methylomirabilota bacterium]
MRRAVRSSWLVAAALLTTSCTMAVPVLERSSRGPSAEDFFIQQSYAANGRAPNFDEKRVWQDQMDEKVFKYLREHPEMEATSRYTEFRFWRQVTTGSTPGEVRVLLGEPRERTIDPALMASLGEQHWPAVRATAKEAWVYPLGWVVFFDDKGVVESLRRVSPLDTRDE